MYNKIWQVLLDCTSVTAKSAKEAKKSARIDLWGCYVIVDVRRELI